MINLKKMFFEWILYSIVALSAIMMTIYEGIIPAIKAWGIMAVLSVVAYTIMIVKENLNDK